MKLKYEIEIIDVDLNKLDTKIEELDKQIDFAIGDIFNCSNQFYKIKRL